MIQRIDTTSVDILLLFPLGTRLVKDTGAPYRYSLAAEGLKAYEKAYCSLPTSPVAGSAGEAIYGHIKAAGEEKELVGVPEVDVGPGQYFWLRTDL